MSQLMRLWHFSSSVNSFFKYTGPAIQWGKMSDFWMDPSSEPSLVAYVISTIISWAGSYWFTFHTYFGPVRRSRLVLGNLRSMNILLIWIKVGQGSAVLAAAVRWKAVFMFDSYLSLSTISSPSVWGDMRQLSITAILLNGPKHPTWDIRNR